MARGGGMLEVELVSADDDGPTPQPRTRRIPRWWLVTGALAVAVAVGVTQWIGVTRDRAYLARVATVPGVLAPVDSSLTVSERVPSADLSRLDGDEMPLVTVAGDGSQSLTWNGWTMQLSNPNGAFADAEGQVRADTTCQPDPSTATQVVCLVTDGGSIYDGAGGVADVAAHGRQVVVLSATDGTVLAQWPVVRGDSMALFAGGVVLGSASARDTTITAYVTLTGEQRWTYVDRQPDGVNQDPGRRYVSIFRAGDLLAYASPGGSLILLSPAGTSVRDVSPPESASWGWGPDPRTGRLEMTSGDTPESSRTLFVAADGDPAGDVTVDGQPLATSVDDDSIPGLLLTSDGKLRAWDAATGAARWSFDVPTVASSMILRGRVFLATDREVVALDGRSGRLLWTTGRQTGLLPSTVATDGRHILVPFDASGQDPASVLVAYDPVSGHEEFRATYPDGVREVSVLGRRLVGHDAASDEYVVLD